MNEFEAENPLQKMWDDLSAKCLCGHGERCYICSGSQRTRLKKHVAALAQLTNYQLYDDNFDKQSCSYKRFPVDYDYFLGKRDSKAIEVKE